MALALLVGPANAGKVARLLDRYLEALDRDPFLIVPNRADVSRVEHDLLARRPALLGGSIGTFDDVFRRIRQNTGAASRQQLTDAQRSLLLSRVVSAASLNGLGPSSRYPGFADALGSAVADLEAAMLDPAEADGQLADLYRAYREELDRLELVDRELARGHAAELVAGDFGAWGSAPVFAYGFEDLTGAQWRLLEALAGRAEVVVSLPYEPLRPAFASLQRTASAHPSRRLSERWASRTRTRAGSRSGARLSARHSSGCFVSPGSAGLVATSSHTCARRTRAWPAGKPISSRAGSAVGPSRIRGASSRSPSGSSGTRCPGCETSRTGATHLPPPVRSSAG